MPPSSTIEPKVIHLLRGKDHPMTAGQIAQVIGCSTQQVYRVLDKLGTCVKEVDRDGNGAAMYEWQEDGTVRPTKLTPRVRIGGWHVEEGQWVLTLVERGTDKEWEIRLEGLTA